MHQSSRDPLAEQLLGLKPTDALYASEFADLLLKTARERQASDLHLLPTPDGLHVQWRLDGMLVSLGVFPPGTATNVVARLKVLADLLTYRTDVPQEGRIRSDDASVEMRVSSFPTLYGEKVVVRLFTSGARYERLDDLGLPVDVRDDLGRLLRETAGAILVTGPTGSGKTTTLYAALRELVAQSGGARSIATLEDPIEVAIPGVAQSQVAMAAGFDLATGLRSIVRQDPEVIMVGEIRDRETAEAALQTSLTGQLVLSSFHASSAAGAVSRLSDMGIEPYVLRSGLLAIVSQRLVRRLCECARPATTSDELLGLDVAQARIAVGCPACSQTGHRGRLVLAEMLITDRGDLGRTILSRSEAAVIGRQAIAAGMIPLLSRARYTVEAGITSPAEVRRVLGFAAE